MPWCERGDSNPHGCPLDPKSSASANSATLARKTTENKRPFRVCQLSMESRKRAGASQARGGHLRGAHSRRRLPIRRCCSRRIGAPRGAFSAGTKRSQEIVGIDSRAVTVAPSKFNRVVSHPANLFQGRPGNRFKSDLRAMSLTHCTWTIAAQILLLVLPGMAVVPGDPDRPFSSGVIYFRREAGFHGLDGE